ncbi:hypothetical protein GCM10009127_03400 [Alteraurantiacibacter aestuarii]|uniref:murein L,D-transpeptidase catalytic domain family protein n=1 Tax=Alteraurantiacibacter aestuarii TaxID=650004 RepID=UPI001F40B8ED|nr:murein L,D-transpeptidase catalytic domain family protein [Alteraurantiacibacter aestuarii]
MPQALTALDTHSSQITQRDVIGLVDFSAHSRELRFQLVNVASGDVAAEWLVAHGRGSDRANSGFVSQFSNQPGSNASSRGSFLIANAYVGRHGRSRRLIGLEPQNNLALDRAIVIHGANYVDRDMARQQGRIGRSLGCFTVEMREIEAVLEKLPEGCLLFASK